MNKVVEKLRIVPFKKMSDISSTGVIFYCCQHDKLNPFQTEMNKSSVDHIHQQILALQEEKDLQQLRDTIDTRCTELQRKREQENVQAEVQAKGYSVQLQFHDEINGLKRFALRYYVKGRCYDREYQSDVHIEAAEEQQDLWCDVFGFAPRHDEVLKLKQIDWLWDSFTLVADDWMESPLEGKGYAVASFYYRPCQSLPVTKEGASPFRRFLQNGEFSSRTARLTVADIENSYILIKNRTNARRWDKTGI